MAESILRKNQKLVEDIISNGAIASKKASDPILSSYIKQFYQGAPIEYLSSANPKSLFQAAVDNWQFASTRNGKKHKVRCYNPKWDGERTVLEMVIDDMPFLIDSVTAELNRLGYRIYQIIHPVMKATRDKSGKLIKAESSKNYNTDLESVMHIQITYIAKDAQRKELEQNMHHILHAVQLSVTDWQPTRKRVEQTIEDLANVPKLHKKSVNEAKNFFLWLLNNHFTFLGCCDYSINKSAAGKSSIKPVPKSELGIFKMEYPGEKGGRGVDVLTHTIQPSSNNRLLDFSKSNRKSIVHRPVHMDYIGIKLFDKKGEVIGERRFLGLYTSSVYFQSATLIPIINKTIESVLLKAGFKPDSHDGKEMVSILENYPRDELFQITESELFEICMGIVELGKRPKVRLFIRNDRFNRFVSCIVFVPRERFTTQIREKIQSILEKSFRGKVIDHYTQVSDSPLARLHVIVQTDKDSKKGNVAEIEKRILEVTNSWVDGLRETLIDALGEKGGEVLFLRYSNAFTASYMSRYHFGGTYKDIIKVEEALATNNLSTDLYRLEEEKDLGSYQLKIYHPVSQVMLSDILPILENMGFRVVDELTFLVKPRERAEVWIHHFRLQIDVSTQAVSANDEDSYIHSIKGEFEDALFKIWHHEIEDDNLNTLILKAAMKWREVVAVRTYAKYMRQIGFSYGYNFITEALSNHPILAGKLIKLFNARFGTKNESGREEKIASALEQIDKSLTTVTNVAEDRVIRKIMDMIMATLRTNYFQKDADGNYKTYISIKLNSKEVPDLPLPRPYREIFVYSCEMEGIHLRGGKVARGGLRWSDRKEDFRTEVLGLMKAQMVKNSVIVPVGSKGGFVVKRPVEGSRDDALAQGIECYKTFLSGLLDVTDNIVKGKIVPPKDVIRHDNDDPYLVVAADKGTASFSDIANAVSKKYDFWLGDAFASGGSAGYDHKKMGITARGGWVAVRRHFMEMGKDIQKEDFTVVGIGDMSGDVFGNGMLLSRHIRLLASFSHINIFIDPNPDAKKSYKERERLFKLPRSSWEDYDKKLISAGGGVFSKFAKSIPISKQMKKVFDISENSLAPDELIKKLLKTDADLLWNGGIGTYVKAESENHEDAGDKANDAVRINGNEARFKVIGEGGNLGLTQLGRIEYAMNGGRINTDAIDNSAGVDCSDHEVNIKIALKKAMDAKKLSLSNRNKLLANMTDEVADLCLRDNVLQTQAISVVELQGPSLLEPQLRLMKKLEEVFELDRKVEFLPDDNSISYRQAIKKGLTRPELAVLLSYSKLAVYDDLIRSNLPDESYLLSDLLLYFPKAMRDKFAQEIEQHELRREIIATVVSNSIVNRVGAKFFFRIMEDTGVKGCDIARSYIAVRDSFDLRSLWIEIEALDGKVTAETQVSMFLDIKQLVERAALWFLHNSAHPLKVSEIVASFAPDIKELKSYFEQVLSATLKNACDKKLDEYLKAGVPQKTAMKISRMEALASACDIVHVARGGKLPIKTVGQIYFEIGTRLSLGWLRLCTENLPTESHWQKLSVQTLTEDIFDQQMKITAEIIRLACADKVCNDPMQKWEETYKKELVRYDAFLSDLKSHDKIDASMVTVAIKRVEAICSL